MISLYYLDTDSVYLPLRFTHEFDSQINDVYSSVNPRSEATLNYFTSALDLDQLNKISTRQKHMIRQHSNMFMLTFRLSFSWFIYIFLYTSLENALSDRFSSVSTLDERKSRNRKNENFYGFCGFSCHWILRWTNESHSLGKRSKSKSGGIKHELYYS